MMDISFSNELCYMSGSSCNQDKDLFFYSAPTSPSRLKLIEHDGSRTGPTTPRSYEDANSNLDRFEFETSRRFNHSEPRTKTNRRDVNAFEQHQRLCEDSLPTMAFADELFCDGKVIPMMPPLKLPPRLVQNGDSTQSSRATSPKSPGSMLRLPFARLWKNDDFDPFKVAFEKVREEKRGKSKGREHGLRRTRSLSPLRVFNSKCDKHEGLSESHKHDQSHCCEKLPLMSFPEGQMLRELLEEPMKEESERENMVSEPKGLAFARQTRQVEVANDTNFELESKKTLVSNVAKEIKKDDNKSGGFWKRNKKIESIKKFFFGNSKKGKASAQQKLEDKKTELEKHSLVKKPDMKSVHSTESTTWSKDDVSGEFTKMRLVCQRPLPKSFLCLGYEGWKVK